MKPTSAMIQTNAYEFGDIGKARSATQMILFHLHNPQAPAHVYKCYVCDTVIPLDTYRFNCPQCSGGRMNMCLNCAEKNPHNHRMSRFKVTATLDDQDADSKFKHGMEKRRQRPVDLDATLGTLVHASSCANANCEEPSCSEARDLILHQKSCQRRASGGCMGCRYLLTLMRLHAFGSGDVEACTKHECAVPNCNFFKLRPKL
jgi:E1A/CREB-binding protein